ncbi:hypothetical protein GCM10022224_046450 [Nonomuraea antimicrobica]|uniref:Phosphopantetheine adenylyltransferase n=1 Tax=Nonomuraea antimicrobica TaxID=561173 RepID=A0ABP7C1X9_9ACTN
MRSYTRGIGMALFAAVGLLNLAPGLVALLPSQLAGVYGVVAADATSTLLLRHRAVMLALLGAALLAAAVLPSLRTPVLLAAAIGKVSFILLVFTSAGAHPKLTPVALADVAALVALAVAAVLLRHPRRTGAPITVSEVC